MMTSTGAGPTAVAAWADARRMEIVGFAVMLWAERKLVLGLGAVIGALGLVAALMTPAQGASLRWSILMVTMLIATVVAVGAGLSRGLVRRSFPTPSSAARALETPVLAVLPRVAAAKPPSSAQAPRPARKGKPDLVLVVGGALAGPS